MNSVGGGAPLGNLGRTGILGNNPVPGGLGREASGLYTPVPLGWGRATGGEALLRIAFLPLAVGVPWLCASAQVYHATPDWSSADMQVSTGAALVDINGDGWLDLVVANGNDISVQRVVVYYNNGNGTLQTSPGWQSSDVAYNGHLDIADVNGDGWPDVAVAVLLAQGGASAKVYLNNQGTLSSLPSWTAPVSANSFGVAFGDMNGDGRPDLAVASGDAYNNVPARNCVYLNTGTTLSSTVSWETGTLRNYNNCLWTDADNDGRLDLVYTGSNTDTFVYRNLGSTLETTPSWRTNDSRNQFALMATCGDVNGDGFRELILCDNFQLFAGTGRFRQYNGLVAGFFATTAGWTYSAGYVSAVALGDIDDDGRLDLCTGEWFGRTRYFLNTGTGFGAAPSFTSGGTSTVEKIVLGDIGKKARRVGVQTFALPAARKVFFLARQPIESVTKVFVDGNQLTPTQYVYNREQAWVAVGATPLISVRVVYVYSRSLDMAVANWDDNKPNQVYYNTMTPPCPADFNGDGFLDPLDYNQFINAFESGDETADFNADGFVDPIDYNTFINHFEAGC